MGRNGAGLSLSSPERSAIVLSGGGANGAYEVGVTKALLLGDSPATGYVPLTPHAFATTSIGALNASILLSHFDGNWAHAINVLEGVWAHLLAGPARGSRNGAFRYRANPFEFLDVVGNLQNPWPVMSDVISDVAYLSRDWFARVLAFAFSPVEIERRLIQLLDVSAFITRDSTWPALRQTMNFDRLRDSAISLSISATRWRTGEVRVFNNADMTSHMGSEIVLASSAIPGLFPPVDVEGEPYVDGGLVMNTPLKPAIDSGAEILHVVYVDPDPTAVPIRGLRNTVDTFSRALVVGFSASLVHDLSIARRINSGLSSGSGASSLDHRKGDTLIRGNSDNDDVYRPLTVHLYHPRDGWDGLMGMLDFDRVRIEDLIERGYLDASDHDCADSGCLLPQ
jgi:predicted acylesterase/phospholipase RssA